MNSREQIEEIKKTLETTKSVFVLIPQNPNLDATAAALALFLSFEEAGKNVMIGSPSKMKVELSRLVGIDKISEKIGNRNLIISFDYKEDSIEKVSYNVEGEKFNLVIQPRSGYPPLDKSSVDFSYEGIDAQMIFVIGAQKLEDLGAIYEKERQAFSQSTTVNIDRNRANTKFGRINVIDQKAASISELVFSIMKNLSFPMNVDIAGNLLKGIEGQTQNFQAPFTSAQTFEAVAELMRAGAKRSATAQQPMRQWTPGQPFPSMPRSLAGMTAQQAASPMGFPQAQPPLKTPPPVPGSDLQTAPPQPRPMPIPPTTEPLTEQQPGKLAEPAAQIKSSPLPQTGQRPVQDMAQKPVQVGPQMAGQRDQKTKYQQSRRQRKQQERPKQQDKPRKDWYGPKIYHGKSKVK